MISTKASQSEKSYCFPETFYCVHNLHDDFFPPLLFMMYPHDNIEVDLSYSVRVKTFASFLMTGNFHWV